MPPHKVQHAHCRLLGLPTELLAHIFRFVLMYHTLGQPEHYHGNCEEIEGSATQSVFISNATGVLMACRFSRMVMRSVIHDAFPAGPVYRAEVCTAPHHNEPILNWTFRPFIDSKVQCLHLDFHNFSDVVDNLIKGLSITWAQSITRIYSSLRKCLEGLAASGPVGTSPSRDGQASRHIDAGRCKDLIVIDCILQFHHRVQLDEEGMACFKTFMSAVVARIDRLLFMPHNIDTIGRWTIESVEKVEIYVNTERVFRAYPAKELFTVGRFTTDGDDDELPSDCCDLSFWIWKVNAAEKRRKVVLGVPDVDDMRWPEWNDIWDQRPASSECHASGCRCFDTEAFEILKTRCHGPTDDEDDA